MTARSFTSTALALAFSSAALLTACDDSANTPAKSDADAEAGTVAKAEKAEDTGNKAIEGKPVDGGDSNPAVKGEKIGGDERYTLSVEPGAATAGAESQVKLTVLPQKEWHMNLEFPTSLTVEAPDGVTLAKAEQKKDDAKTLNDETCEYEIGFTANDAGEKVFKGQFKFAVCQDKGCFPVTEQLEFKVAVK